MHQQFSNGTPGPASVESTLWRYRFSASVCLLDATVEAQTVLRSSRKRPSGTGTEGQGPLSAPGPPSMYLALFAIGVLHQAIKICSMRGIPMPQALTASFFASLLSIMAHMSDPESDDKSLAAHVHQLKTTLDRHTYTAIGLLTSPSACFEACKSKNTRCIQGMCPCLKLRSHARRSGD